MSVWFSIVSASLLYIFFLLSKDIVLIAYIKYANQSKATTPTHRLEWERKIDRELDKEDINLGEEKIKTF